MNRDLLKLIREFNLINNQRLVLEASLEQEAKAQRMCATQLRNSEKKLTEKMERRDEMLKKYSDEFAGKLAMHTDSIAINKELCSASLICKLFGKNYVLFNVDGLDRDSVEAYGSLLEEMAANIIRSRVILGNSYSPAIESMLKLNKEINASPELSKEKLILREIAKREQAIKEKISELRQRILEDESFMQHYQVQIADKEPIKDNLINKIIKRKQLKAQNIVAQCSKAIELNNAKIAGYTEQLEDKQQIKSEVEIYVAEQLKQLSTYIELINAIDAVKRKIEVYNARYVKTVIADIEQQKTAIKSSETMQAMRRTEISQKGEQINDFLIEVYKDQKLVDKLLAIKKQDCTPEQWQVISIIKQHYNDYVANNLDTLLN